MAASDAVRFLSKAGVDDELALEMFFDAVLEEFYAQTLLYNVIADGGVAGDQSGYPTDIVRSKTINSGKSWQFVMVADSPAPEYATPGNELLGQNYAFDEGTITIDGILVAHHDVPIDQQQLSHFEVMGPLAKGIGRTLARDFDQKLFSIAVQAANAAASTKDSLTVHNGGNKVDRVAATVAAGFPVSATGARNFRDDLEELASLLDIDNVPEQGRFISYTPYIHRVLQQDTTIFDSQFSASSGDLNQRVIGTIAGFNVLGRSNHIPTTNITSSSLSGSVPSKYQYDFTVAGGNDGTPVCVAFCGGDEGRAGIGYVAAGNEKLGPIYAVVEKDERRNTMFLKGQMMVGADILYPPCAGAIMVDNA